MTTAVAPLTLRPYQQRSVALAHDAVRAGHKRVLVVSPTGSGKRMVAVWWARKAAEQEREVLFVTDRRLLIKQAAEELAAFGIPHGVIMDGYEENRQPRIQLASIQTLESRYLGTINEEDLPHADLVLIDEAHQSITSYIALLARYDAANAFLLTATPVGPAGRTLIQPGYASVMTEGVRNSELIRQGFLLPTTGVAPSEPWIEGVTIRNKEEFAAGALTKRVKACTCFADVYKAYIQYGEDRQTVLFSPGIDFCADLQRGFKTFGISSEVLTSKVKDKDRPGILDRFESGETRVLISVKMLGVGFDCPIASCAIDLQPNNQLREYWQKVGRIKRPCPGQEHAVYIDMAGNYWRHPHPDDDPDWDAVTGEESTQSVLEAARLRGRAERQIRCPKCGVVRKGGPVCPGCNHEPSPQEVVRVMRMLDGKLKEIPAVEKRKHEKTADDRRRDKWKSTLFVGLKCGKTLKQCAWIHKSKHGDWPAGDLPCVPATGSANWALRVDQVYSSQQLMREFKR